MIETAHLTSGCQVVTEVIPGARSVALGVMVEAGSQLEPPGQRGAAHLLEHLLFRGAQGRSEAELADHLDRLGGDSNAFTDKEVMTAYVRTVAERGDEALELLAAVTQRPLLEAQHLEAERSIVLDELLARDDEAGDVAQLLLEEALYGDHPLGADVLGDASTLGRIGRDELAAFHEATYAATRTVVVAVGAVDHHRVVDLAEASFDARQATISRPAPPMAATTASTTIAEHDGGQVHLLLGIHSPGAGSPDIVAAQVAAHALGGGVSSRLFRAIRDEAALAYSVGADVAATAEVGSLGVYCASAPANMGAVIDRIAAELDDLGRGGLTAAEFERSREAVRTDLLLSADEPLSRLGRLGYETLLLGGPTELAERVARLDALRFADVAEVAATLGTGLRHGVLVGPGTEGCRRQLEEACRL